MIILHFHLLDERDTQSGRPAEYVRIFDSLPDVVARTARPGYELVSETDTDTDNCPPGFPYGFALLRGGLF